VILIGKDLILGLGSSSLLYPKILRSLNHRKLSFLYQPRGGSWTGSFDSYWKDNGEITLSREITIEWDYYCSSLSGSGIQIQDMEDELKWTGGYISGVLTVG
jgi:hypothetical protein